MAWNAIYKEILQAYKELGLMMMLVGVAVLTFASLVFFAEKDVTFYDSKWTFLDSVWWGIMTLTTVGHHVRWVKHDGMNLSCI